MAFLRSATRAPSALADAARDRKDWREAARLYGEHLAANPEDGPIWIQLGHARKESGDYRGAEQAYLRALSMLPEDADLHVQLGHLEKVKGKAERAYHYYARALEIDPAATPALEEMQRRKEENAERSGAEEQTKQPDAGQLEAMAKKLEGFRDQSDVLRAMGFELQRLRTRIQASEDRESELARKLGAFEERAARAERAFEERLARLESRSPAVEGRFSAILDHIATLRTEQADRPNLAATEEVQRKARERDR